LQVSFTADQYPGLTNIHSYGLIISLKTMETTASTPKLVMDSGTVDKTSYGWFPWLLRGQIDTWKPVNLPSNYKATGLPVDFVASVINANTFYPLINIIEISSPR
jgi:hypothetical protein